MKDTLFRNVQFVDIHGDVHDGIDVLVSRRMSSWGTSVHAEPGRFREVVCKDGRYLLLAAAIDCHVHFREPGFEHKETILSGSKAAQQGGTLAVMDMPNTNPWTDSVEAILNKRQRGIVSSSVKFAVAGGITDNNVHKTAMLSKAADALKGFLAESFGPNTLSMTGLIEATKLLESESAARVPLFLHAELPSLLRNEEGLTHLEARPEEAEIECVKQVVELAAETDAWLHVTHVSSLESLRRIRGSGLPNLTFDVAVRTMLLNAELWPKLGSLMKVNPPIRDRVVSQGLQDAFKRGEIPLLVSDHSPHTLIEKKTENPPSGAPGVQEYLSTVVDFAIRNGMGWNLIANAIAYEPARVLGMNAENWLSGGNFVVIDKEAETTVTREWVKSKAGWSLWEGSVLKGVVKAVFQSGHRVMGSL